MRLRVRRWGNSLAIRIPAQIARSLGWEDRSPVQMSLLHGVLSFHSRESSRLRLRELLVRSAMYKLAQEDEFPPTLENLGPGDVIHYVGEDYVVISAKAYNRHRRRALVVQLVKEMPTSVFGWTVMTGPAWGVADCETPQVLDLKSAGLSCLGRLENNHWVEIKDRVMAVLDA